MFGKLRLWLGQKITRMIAAPGGLCISLVLFTPITMAELISESPERPAFKMAFHSSRYNHMDETGNPSGVTIALVRAIAEQMGWRVTFTEMPYLRAVQALSAGEVDMMYALEVEGTAMHLPTGVVVSADPIIRVPLSIYALANRDIAIDSWAQTGPYNTGIMRIAPKKHRQQREGQGNVYYFNSNELLSKALKVGRVDLVVSEPASARVMGNELKMELKRLFDYSHLGYYPAFSRSSPRVSQPMALCLAYVKALTQVVDSGLYLRILKAYDLDILMPYYHSVARDTGDCRLNQSQPAPPTSATIKAAPANK